MQVHGRELLVAGLRVHVEIGQQVAIEGIADVLVHALQGGHRIHVIEHIADFPARLLIPCSHDQREIPARLQGIEVFIARFEPRHVQQRVDVRGAQYADWLRPRFLAAIRQGIAGQRQQRLLQSFRLLRVARPFRAEQRAAQHRHAYRRLGHRIFEFRRVRAASFRVHAIVGVADLVQRRISGIGAFEFAFAEEFVPGLRGRARDEVDAGILRSGLQWQRQRQQQARTEADATHH